MYFRSALLIATALFCSSAASAQSPAPSDSAAAPKFGEWTCFPPSDDFLYNLTFASGPVRVNNFVLAESKAFVTDAPLLGFSASVANRSDKNIAVTVEIAGLGSSGQPTFALSGDAGFGFIAPNKNEEVKATIATERGAVKGAAKICVRVAAYRAAK